jgi:hypothetical protein
MGLGSVSVRRRLIGEFASRTMASSWKPQITWAPGRAGIFREDTVTDPISLTKVPSAVGRPTMKFITANQEGRDEKVRGPVVQLERRPCLLRRYA